MSECTDGSHAESHGSFFVLDTPHEGWYWILQTGITDGFERHEDSVVLVIVGRGAVVAQVLGEDLHNVTNLTDVGTFLVFAEGVHHGGDGEGGTAVTGLHLQQGLEEKTTG